MNYFLCNKKQCSTSEMKSHCNFISLIFLNTLLIQPFFDIPKIVIHNMLKENIG